MSDVRERLLRGGLENVDIANINSPVQVVISGPQADVRAAESLFADAAAFVPLNVSGAFHSRTIEKRIAAANKAKTSPLFLIPSL